MDDPAEKVTALLAVAAADFSGIPVTNGVSMTNCLSSVAFVILALGVGRVFAWPPAEPRQKGPEQFAVDPAAMLDRFFSADNNEDEKALAAIEVSPKEEG